MTENLRGNENEAAAFSRSHRKATLRRIPGYGAATRETAARAEARRSARRGKLWKRESGGYLHGDELVMVRRDARLTLRYFFTRNDVYAEATCGFTFVGSTCNETLQVNRE